MPSTKTKADQRRDVAWSVGCRQTPVLVGGKAVGKSSPSGLFPTIGDPRVAVHPSGIIRRGVGGPGKPGAIVDSQGSRDVGSHAPESPGQKERLMLVE